MFESSEQTILFQSSVSDWQATMFLNRCLPKEPQNPLYVVRNAVRNIKYKSPKSD